MRVRGDSDDWGDSDTCEAEEVERVCGVGVVVDHEHHVRHRQQQPRQLPPACVTHSQITPQPAAAAERVRG